MYAYTYICINIARRVDDIVASMAWKLYAIEQTQLQKHRVDAWGA